MGYKLFLSKDSELGAKFADRMKHPGDEVIFVEEDMETAATLIAVPAIMTKTGGKQQIYYGTKAVERELDLRGDSSFIDDEIPF